MNCAIKSAGTFWRLRGGFSGSGRYLSVEDYLKNIEAWCWRYKENIRNYPGLHFTATNDACDKLLRLLRLLRREGNGARRTVPLRSLRPEDSGKIAGSQDYEWYGRLRVALHEESERLRQMSFRLEGDTVLFDFTDRFLAEFEQGLTDVRRGKGDYAIEPYEKRKEGRLMGELDRRSDCLWFWPCFGHLGLE